MAAERSSMILLIAIAGLIALMILGSIWWVHSTDTNPKAPMHSAMRGLRFSAAPTGLDL
jgi:hypothetical protein